MFGLKFTGFCVDLVLFFFSVAAPGISASPSEDNMRYFNVMILGPTQSPYEGNIVVAEQFCPSVALKALFLLISFLSILF